MKSDEQYLLRLSSVSNNDVGRVGGKNASLGEMIQYMQETGIHANPTRSLTP